MMAAALEVAVLLVEVLVEAGEKKTPFLKNSANYWGIQ